MHRPISPDACLFTASLYASPKPSPATPQDTPDEYKQNTCLPARLQLMSDKLKDGGCGAPYNLEVGRQRRVCWSR